MRRYPSSWLTALLVCLLAANVVAEEGLLVPAPKRLLLLSQGPDGHPKGTHEYAAGQRILAKCLSQVPGLKVTEVRVDGDWPEGPEILSEADGVALFVSEGAKWLNADPKRRAAFAELAQRGGGLSVLHWGMGTKDAANIEPFVALFGACHGGPDRKFKVVETIVRIAAPDHPATAGMADFTIKEEFYYALKRRSDTNPKRERGAADNFTPLLTALIDGEQQMVGWAWERPAGGRSFGYSGCHFHEHWSRPEYQRFLAQGVLWTLNITPPKAGFPPQITSQDVVLP